MSNKSSFKEKFKLFLFFLDDIENYSKIKNEIVLPTNIAQILNPITSETQLYKLIKDKNDQRKKGTNQNNDKIKETENEELEPHLKIINSKRGCNPTCFNQCSIYNANLLFNGRDETKLLSNIVIKQIKSILSQSYNWVSESIKYCEGLEDDFILLSNRPPKQKITKEVKYINDIYYKNDHNDIRIQANDNIFTQSVQSNVYKSRNVNKHKTYNSKLYLSSSNKYSSFQSTTLNSSKKETPFYKTTSVFPIININNKKLLTKNEKGIGFCSKNQMEQKLLRQFDYSELLALRTGKIKIKAPVKKKDKKKTITFNLFEQKEQQINKNN